MGMGHPRGHCHPSGNVHPTQADVALEEHFVLTTMGLDIDLAQNNLGHNQKKHDEHELDA